MSSKGRWIQVAETVRLWTAVPTHQCPNLNTKNIEQQWLNYHLLRVKRLGSTDELLFEKTGGINTKIKQRPARVAPRQSPGPHRAAAEDRRSEEETLVHNFRRPCRFIQDASSSLAVAFLSWSPTEHML